MNKRQLMTVRKALECLQGQKLRCVNRIISMGDFGFGDDMDKTVHRRNEHNVLMRTIIKAPRYVVHIDGRFRMTCGDEIVLSKDDMFQPSTKKENEPGFDWDQWAADEEDGWDVRGNNRYDEICEKYFKGDLSEFIVKKVSVSRWGDLKIAFENGFVLETFVDISGDGECWRFFIGNDLKSHIVVTGNGLEKDDELEE